MNGRIYDSALGRFLSADPLNQDIFNTQTYNAYSYVLNNPLSYTDPTGMATAGTTSNSAPNALSVLWEKLKNTFTPGYGLQKPAANGSTLMSNVLKNGSFKESTTSIYAYPGYFTANGDYIPMTPEITLDGAYIRSLQLDGVDGAIILNMLGRSNPYRMGKGAIIAAKLALYSEQSLTAKSRVRAIPYMAIAAPMMVDSIVGGLRSGGIVATAGEVVTTESNLSLSREMIARSFYRQNTNLSAAKIESHLLGIDFSKPVEIINISPGTRLSQWNFPGAKIGNYFTDLGVGPSNLGIYTNGRVESVIQFNVKMPALRSTAATITDNFSVEGLGITAQGGNRQFFVPNIK